MERVADFKLLKLDIYLIFPSSPIHVSSSIDEQIAGDTGDLPPPFLLDCLNCRGKMSVSFSGLLCSFLFLGMFPQWLWR